VLVARGSVRLPDRKSEINQETDRRLRERLEKNPVDPANVSEVRKQILEQVKAEESLVPPGYWKPWAIDMGAAGREHRNEPLYLRIKFNAADKNASGTFDGVWRLGVPRETQLWQSEVMSLAPDTFHEFQVPGGLVDEKGVLTIRFLNANNTVLLFPLDEGIEVLYPAGGFGLNFARGLGIIFCWIALLAAVGLAAASLLSFPVAAFFSLGLLVVVLCSSIMSSAVTEGTIANYNAEKGTKGFTPADLIAIPMFQGALAIIGLAKDFSPVDSLSTGRNISWEELGRAFGQIVLLLGGGAAAVGMAIFTRRELATAQGTQ